MVLVIGILAAIAVPQYFKSVERGRFGEATSCFKALKTAQERYIMRNNTYSTDPALLDVNCPADSVSRAFTMPPSLSGVAASSWLAILTRKAPVTTGYGAYLVSFRGPEGTYTCNNTNCTNDLLP